jgi:hypothetical protein
MTTFVYGAGVIGGHLASQLVEQPVPFVLGNHGSSGVCAPRPRRDDRASIWHRRIAGTGMPRFQPLHEQILLASSLRSDAGVDASVIDVFADLGVLVVGPDRHERRGA